MAEKCPRYVPVIFFSTKALFQAVARDTLDKAFEVLNATSFFAVRVFSSSWSAPV